MINPEAKLGDKMPESLCFSLETSEFEAPKEREDLVGKRILCLLNPSFKVPTISPVQFSSALWSCNTLKSLNLEPHDELETKSQSNLIWSQNQHQCSQNIHQVEKLRNKGRHSHPGRLDDLTESCNFTHSNRANRVKDSGKSWPGKNSYSVAKKLHEASASISSASSSPTSYATQATTLVHDINDYLPSDRSPESSLSCSAPSSGNQGNDLNKLTPSHLNTLPWRLGIIRAVSHRNLDNKELDLMIEFDLIDWETRDWYPVYDRIDVDDQDYNSGDDGDVCQLLNKRTAAPSHAHVKKKNKKPHAERNKATRDTEETESHSSSDNLEALPISHQHQQDEKTKMNSKCGNNDQQPVPKESDHSIKRSFKRVTPGAFAVLLVESSICCLGRRHSPTGMDKLWPALTFKPLVDELGLFKLSSAGTNLKAIEYFEPDVNGASNNCMQPTCDIDAVISELKSDLVDLTSNIRHKLPETPCQQLIDKSSFVEDSHLQNGLNDNYGPYKSNPDCRCWSPRVEFVPESQVYAFHKEDTSGKYVSFLSSICANLVKPSLKDAEPTVGDKVLSKSKNITSSTNVRKNLNSFRKFLRFYHYVHLVNQKSSQFSEKFIGFEPDSESIHLKESKQSHEAYLDTNDLIEAIAIYPALYRGLREWHFFQDSQSILASVYTASLLVSQRIRVYRSSGTTQWYTAVIIAYDEKTNLFTLIDDTVLEEHHEDPNLLEMHLIDDGFIQSITEGDVATATGGAFRRRNQRTNQRQAAQTAQKAIMNTSTSFHGLGAGYSTNISDRPVGTIHSNKQHHGRNVPPTSLLLSPSSSSSASSVNGQQLSDISSNQNKLIAVQMEHNQKLTVPSRKTNSKESSKDPHQTILGHTSFLASNELDDTSSICWMSKLSYTNSADVRAETPKGYSRLIESVELKSASERRLFKVGREQRSMSDKDSQGPDVSFLQSPGSKANSITSQAEDKLGCVELRKSPEPSIDGRNLLSHRLRLEALEERPALQFFSRQLGKPDEGVHELINSAPELSSSDEQQGYPLKIGSSFSNESSGESSELTGLQKSTLDEKPTDYIQSQPQAGRSQFSISERVARQVCQAGDAARIADECALLADEPTNGASAPVGQALVLVGSPAPRPASESAPLDGAVLPPVPTTGFQATKVGFSGGGSATLAADRSLPDQAGRQQQQWRPEWEQSAVGRAKKQQRHNNNERPPQLERQQQRCRQQQHKNRQSKAGSLVEALAAAEAALAGAESSVASAGPTQTSDSRLNLSPSLICGGHNTGFSIANNSSNNLANLEEQQQRLPQQQQPELRLTEKLPDREREQKREREKKQQQFAQQLAFFQDSISHQEELVQNKTLKTLAATSSNNSNSRTQPSESQTKPQVWPASSYNLAKTFAKEKLKADDYRKKPPSNPDTSISGDSSSSSSKTLCDINYQSTQLLTGATERHQPTAGIAEQTTAHSQKGIAYDKPPYSIDGNTTSNDNNSFTNDHSNATEINQNSTSSPSTSPSTSRSGKTATNCSLTHDQQAAITGTPQPTLLNQQKGPKLVVACDTSNQEIIAPKLVPSKRLPTSLTPPAHHILSPHSAISVVNSFTKITLPSSTIIGSNVLPASQIYTSNNNCAVPWTTTLSSQHNSNSLIQQQPSSTINKTLDNISNQLKHQQIPTISLDHQPINTTHQKFAPVANTLQLAATITAAVDNTVPTTTISATTTTTDFSAASSAAVASEIDATHPVALPAKAPPALLPRVSSEKQTSLNSINLAVHQKHHHHHSAHSMATHNFGPNLQEQKKSGIAWPNNYLAPLQHQQPVSTNTATTSSSVTINTTTANNAQLHSQQAQLSPQQLQQATHYGSHTSSAQQQLQLQSSIASRVDQIIRTTLHDSLHMPKGSSNTMSSSSSPILPPTSSSSSTAAAATTVTLPVPSVIFSQPANLSISANNNTITTNNNNIALNVSNSGPMGLLSAASSSSSSSPTPLTSMFTGSAMSTADTINKNNSVVSNTINNLSNKTIAHSASHSALAAAAALQSLNQSNFQRSQQLAQLQQHSSTSSSLTSTNITRPMSNPIPPNNYSVPKLGITSTTSSDHHNHNHNSSGLPSVTQYAPAPDNNKLDFSLQRFQQGLPPGARLPPISWQDQINLSSNAGAGSGLGGGGGGGNPRWNLYNNPYAANPLASIPSSPFPTNSNPSSNTGLPTSLVKNLSNSNNMIGQDGDNNQVNHTKLKAPPTSSAAPSMNRSFDNNSSVAPQSHTLQPRQSTQWPIDVSRGPPTSMMSSPTDAIKLLQSQRLVDEMENGSERLNLFIYNLVSNCLPGTTKPKKIVPLDSIDGLRQAICCGEFYCKYEDFAVGILSNQMIVPEFSIIDYIRREKFSSQEMERIESVHKRLGLPNLLLELAQRSYPAKLSLDMKPPPPLSSLLPPMSHIDTTNNHLNLASTNPYFPAAHQQVLVSKNGSINPLPPPPSLQAKTDPLAHLPGLDKNRRSSQSPNTINARSQSISDIGSSAAPRILNFQNSFISTNPVLNPVRGTNQSQIITSFLSPSIQNPHVISTRPSRANSTTACGLSYDSPSINSNIGIRQPPAAHQSSVRPNPSLGPLSQPGLAHLSSNSSGPTTQPVIAHMSSKTPQTPRLLPSNQENFVPSAIPKVTISESQSNPSAFTSNSASGRMTIGPYVPDQMMGGYPNVPRSSSDVDPITGLPFHTLANLKHGVVNPPMTSNKSFMQSHLIVNNNHNPGFLGQPPLSIGEISRSPCNLDARSQMNFQLQSIYGAAHNSPNLNNDVLFKNQTGSNSFTGQTSMPPPSNLDYQKNELGRMNDPRMPLMPPGSNNNSFAGNPDQLKQYSALMSCISPQQQQQLKISLGLASPNSIYNQGQQISNSIPNVAIDPNMFGLQGPSPVSSFQDGNLSGPPSQQPSPRQTNSYKVNLSTGQASGQKRSKKPKLSPVGSINQPTTEIKSSLSPNLTSSSATNNLDTGNKCSAIAAIAAMTTGIRSNSDINDPQSLSSTDLNHVLTQQQAIGGNNNLLIANVNVANAGNVDSCMSTTAASIQPLHSSSPDSEPNAVCSRTNPLSGFSASAGQNSGAVACDAVSPDLGSCNDLPKNKQRQTLTEGREIDQTCVHRDESPNNACETNLTNLTCSSTTTNLSAPKSEKTSSSDSMPEISTEKLLIATANNNATATNPSSINEPTIKLCAYPKLKKAWLINYDQEEDQAKSSKSCSEYTVMMDVDKKNDSVKTENSPTATNSFSSKTVITTNKDEKNNNATSASSTAQAKNGKKMKPDCKKKTKSSAIKKKANSPITTTSTSSSARASRNTISKTVYNDSEASNASTSDIDSDEANCAKSDKLKRLRRMPRRKAKPSSEREELNQQRSPKSKNATVTTSTLAATSSSNTQQRKEKSPKKPKESSEFLQIESCYEIVQKSIRCLECRRVRVASVKNDKITTSKQTAKTNWDDFCRFYEFRKLRIGSNGTIVVAGFSDLDDARESDKSLWLPRLGEIPENISFEEAQYIISNVGDEFCKIVRQERAARDMYEIRAKNEARINWKRTVSGLRELCDVCSTTLFNCHYVCERCGFVVCLDCLQVRAENEFTNSSKKESTFEKSSSFNTADENGIGGTDSTETPVTVTSKQKNRKDSLGWIYCAKNEEHSHDKLVLTQIIAADCLEELWKLLHETRKKFKLGNCVCEKDETVQDQQDLKVKVKLEDVKEYGDKTSTIIDDGLTEINDLEQSSESSHSTLKGLLLAAGATTNGSVLPESNGSEDERTIIQKSGSDERDDERLQKIFKSEDRKDVSSGESKPIISSLSEMFNDSSNELDSQEDSKLSQQVTAAIEGCISSLANGLIDSPESESNIFEAKPPTKLESIKTIVDNHSESNNKGSIDKETHSWLVNGDLLVLSESDHEPNIDLFRQQWRLGKPVVVRGVEKLMKIDMWLPQFFGKEFGDYRSDLVDCRNGDIHRHSMKKYWEGFEPTNSGTGSSKKKTKDDVFPAQIPSANNEELSNGPSYYSGSALWRLKDWPPGQDFYEILPSHYDDFMNNLPLKEYTTRGGKLNLACRLPKEMLKPDLGPKMYSAYGTSRFPERGTTNLHLDISDAINVMVYVGGATSFNNGSDEVRDTFDKIIDDCDVDESMKKQIRTQNLVPGALWHIFKPSDVQKMREFLKKVSVERNISKEKSYDPIHDQTWYLDQVLLNKLELEYGVKSYPILQCMGDAILIPAGAPHQVKNLQNCIKVANDFVSPENVRFCLQLTNEFRKLPETHINQEDKLQIKNILYHSVKESLQYLSNHPVQ